MLRMPWLTLATGCHLQHSLSATYFVHTLNCYTIQEWRQQRSSPGRTNFSLVQSAKTPSDVLEELLSRVLVAKCFRHGFHTGSLNNAICKIADDFSQETTQNCSVKQWSNFHGREGFLFSYCTLNCIKIPGWCKTSQRYGHSWAQMSMTARLKLKKKKLVTWNSLKLWGWYNRTIRSFPWAALGFLGLQNGNETNFTEPTTIGLHNTAKETRYTNIFYQEYPTAVASVQQKLRRTN